jgi:alkylation response protein AidB-like acyl-CoA dehydrogenase
MPGTMTGVDGFRKPTNPASIAAIFQFAMVTLVVVGPWADQLIVIARLDDSPTRTADSVDFTRPRDAVRLGAFIVSPHAAGLTATSRKTIDGSVASEIRLENVLVNADGMIGSNGDASAVIERIVDEATVALCAEASGAIESLPSATVDYAKARKQFGQPNGKFQVLQHRMVDMLIARVQLSSIVHHASGCLTADAPIRRRAVSACKTKISQTGTCAVRAAAQTHGGIGITDELAVSTIFAGWSHQHAIWELRRSRAPVRRASRSVNCLSQCILRPPAIT